MKYQVSKRQEIIKIMQEPIKRKTKPVERNDEIKS